MKGEVEIYHENGVFANHRNQISLAKLEKGKYFGEIAFFSGRERTASARSISFTTLYSLSRNDCLEILCNFKDDWVKKKKFCKINLIS